MGSNCVLAQQIASRQIYEWGRWIQCGLCKHWYSPHIENCPRCNVTITADKSLTYYIYATADTETVA